MVMVSVVMVTYNHEKFIEKAIYGALNQKTDYDLEVIVADDNSPDNTKEIVNKIIKTHPCGSRIKYIKHATNKGVMKNFSFALKQCQGKYIALCDGDDYWIDPHKLQKQVNFLEENTDCSIVFHACKRVKNNKVEITRHIGRNKMDLNDYLNESPFIASASLFFKKEIIKHYQNWMFKLFAADFVLRYLAFLQGKMGYIDEVMSVYNKGTEGSWSKRKMTVEVALREYKDNCKMLNFIKQKSTTLTPHAFKTKKHKLRLNTIFKIATSKKIIDGFLYLYSKKESNWRNLLRYLKIRIF